MGEQAHIAAALTFELSKVKTPAIRERMVSHLLNIDETLANKVAGKLGLQKMPKPADAAMPTRQDLDPSPALSIVENGPERFEGRKLGILVSEGSDAGLLKALKGALDKAGATFEIIAPKVTGVKASDGSWIEADQMIDGGPSVLYDAVALLPAAAAMDDLLQESAARDFVADAFAHCKFIGYVESALPLFEKSGIAAEDFDEGCIALGSPKDAKSFVEGLAKLRVWGREAQRKNALETGASHERTWKTKFDNAPTSFGSKAVRPMVHGDVSELTPRGASILLFCRLPKFGRLSALAITIGRFPASSVFLLRERSRSAVRARSHLPLFCSGPGQTPPANRMETNNENRPRRAHLPALCGQWRPMEQRSISGFRSTVREVKDRPNADGRVQTTYAGPHPLPGT